LLSVGGRLMLLNSVLSNLHLFMFSFFEIPKEVLKKIETFRSQIFFGKMRGKRRRGYYILAPTFKANYDFTITSLL
jgi:hypothetical protein